MSASLMRRCVVLMAIAWVLVAGLAPAQAAEIVIDIYPGTGADPVPGVRNPRAALDRGGVVDGLPALRAGKRATIPWSRIRHVVFVPGDIPTAIITYRDGREDMVDIEPCRIVSTAARALDIDIHDVAEIDVH